MAQNIHQGQPVIQSGADEDEAKLNVILLHGRGATAESMVPLAEALHRDGIRFLIPQAARDYWYPQSAFAPIEANEPDLSSALRLINSLVQELSESGYSDRQIAFGGFSQGACLAAEYVARNARPYAGLFVFSGALIGPEDLPQEYSGNYAAMPVFIGGSDVDPWVAHRLLQNTAEVFEAMGARVDFQTYPGLGHTVNQAELDHVSRLLDEALIEAETEL